MAQTLDKAQISMWKKHLQEEVDAAYLYGILAKLATHEKQKEVFSKLHEIENRHAEMMKQLLEEHHVSPPPLRPSLKARIMAWVAQKYNPNFLINLMLREEGQEVKAYLKMSQIAASDSARNVTHQIARESMAHAEIIKEISGAEGEPWHQTESGGFLRNVIYGFNDGLTANFGLVAGVIGASVQSHILLVSGIAGMVADALSMGSSGYLAAKSEAEVYAHEIEMERQEIELMPELETEELALIYEAKGMPPDEARKMATEVMKNPERALEEKVREELKIGEAHTTPLKEGIITGVATAFGAFIPVAPFMVLEGELAVWVSFVISMLSHFVVGAARSFFTGRGMFRSGLDMFLVGLGIAIVGYYVGDWLVTILR